MGILRGVIGGLAFMIGAVLVGPAPSASACSCAAISWEQSLESAEVVLLGKVTRVRDGAGDVRGHVVGVERVYRGAVAAETVIESAADSASCGTRLPTGRTMVIVAHRDGDRLETGLCSGSRPATKRTREAAVVVLGEGAGPRQEKDPSVTTFDAREARARTTRLVSTFGAASVILAGVGGVVLLRRRRNVGVRDAASSR